MIFNGNNLDTFRYLSRGKYDTDFEFLNANSKFPSDEVRGRAAVYRFRAKQYDGTYAYNRYVTVLLNNIDTDIPYSVITVNYFKLVVNKMIDLITNNDYTIKTGDLAVDKLVNKLVERTGWRSAVNQAFFKVIKFGDCVMKTYKGGVSVTDPLTCFKVVDSNDTNKTLGVVLYEPLRQKIHGQLEYTKIRFEIHFKGKIYECVKQYSGGFYTGTIGESVEYTYKGRTIKKEGNWYETGVDDVELVQWLTVNKEADGVYGESVFQDIQDIIFAMEKRLSIMNGLLDNQASPMLIMGMSSLEETEQGYRVKTIYTPNGGQVLVTEDRVGDKFMEPKPLQQVLDLSNSENMLDILRSYFYELSEMGKTFLSGEYGGNISEETLNNTIKSAIDKANRVVTEVYDKIRDSLYALCKLNGIDVNREDITITFNIGRTDDDMRVAEICKTLIEAGILSKNTVRSRYFGYNEEQSKQEQEQIDLESGTIKKESEPAVEVEDQTTEILEEDKQYDN